MTVADLHAEQSVLGAMLLDRRAIAEVRPLLSPDDFYRGAHRSLYEAVTTLAGRGEPADAVTVTDELERRGWLEAVGGASAVAAVMTATPSAATALHYARIVADRSARRRLAEQAQEAAQTAVDLTVPVDATAAELRDKVAGTRNGRIRCLSDAELDNLPAPTWLIDGHVPEGMTVLYGPSGAGKSFVALDWAYSIASGTPWFGRTTTRKPVVYVAGEGAHGIKRRREAWRRDRGHSTAGVHTIPDPVNMLDSRDAATVSGIVGDRCAGVLLLDTLARTLHGNENDTETIGGYIAACDRIRAEHGCSIIVVHHTGLDTSRMRGNQRLFSDVDCVIRVRQDDSGNVEVAQPPPPAGKAKDAAHFEPWTLSLRVLDAGVDDNGEVVTSCVLTTTAGRAYSAREDVAALLADTEPLTFMEIASRTGWDIAALRVLAEQGVIVRHRDGGPSARYTLPNGQATGYQGAPL